MAQHEHHHCHDDDQQPWQLGKKLKRFGGLFLLFFAASFLPGLEVLNQSIIDYLALIWWAVLLGLLLGGVIDYFVPEGFIFKYLGQPRRRSLLYAVVAGFLLSACSHGILALAIQLYKKGARTSSVIAFLLASPWANLPITILLFSFFGWQAALLVGAAMLIALTTGAVYMLLEDIGWVEGGLAVAQAEHYQWDRVKQFDLNASVKGVSRGALNLANMVLWWILIGFMLAALIKAYVPAHAFMQYFGPDGLGLLLTLLFATVIEVCSEGSSPIAFEIYNKVQELGNPFVFLMAGVVTDYTEIGLLWSNIGKRAALWLPVLAVPQVMLIAYLFNLLL